MASFRRGVKQRQNRTEKSLVCLDVFVGDGGKRASSVLLTWTPFAVTRSPKGVCVECAPFRLPEATFRPPSEIRPKDLWKEQLFYAVFG